MCDKKAAMENIENSSSENSTLCQNVADNLQELVHAHLKELLQQFKDPKKGQRILSKKMGIHEKTLNRILEKENKPSYQTLYRFYRVYFDEYNDSELLKKVPALVREYLIKSNAQTVSSTDVLSVQTDKILLKNPVMLEIFLLVATGAITKDVIHDKFGQYGLNLVEKMCEEKILKEIHKDVYILGSNKPNFEEDLVVKAGLTLTEAYAKTIVGEELDHNFISFFAEGLSEEAYKEWLYIDQEAFRKKVELTRDAKNLGKVRAFTFVVTETMQADLNYQ